MGLFGGSKKSSKTTNVTETNTVNTTLDASGNEGEVNNQTSNTRIALGNMDDNNRVTINNEITDFGALDTAGDIADGAFGVAGSAFDLVGNSVERTMEAVAQNNAAAISAVTSASKEGQKTARAAAESDTTETIKTLVYGLSAVGVAWALSIAIKKM